MGRAHEVRAASMAKTAAIKSKLYSRFGKELYIAAKSGVPDPDMNLSLKRKIAEAKSNQVPADVIKRAIDKAKGGTDENYTEARYEGFGPGNSTVIVDCLTDNTNRSMTEVKTAFNKSRVLRWLTLVVFLTTMNQLVYSYLTMRMKTQCLKSLLEAEVDVTDLTIEDGVMTVKTAFTDFGKAQDAIEKLLPNIEFETCETTMLPNEYVTLTDPEEIEAFHKLMDMLNEADDVNKVYHNAIINE